MSTSTKSYRDIQPSAFSIGKIRNWSIYLSERFPVIAHGILISSFYSCHRA